MWRLLLARLRRLHEDSTLQWAHAAILSRLPSSRLWRREGMKKKKKGGPSSCVIARAFKDWRILVNGTAGVMTVQESQKALLCAI